MECIETVIVGGGPAGSSAAWQLCRQGRRRDCIVLDAQKFPRLKLCAGWVTPKVLADLEIDPASYPHHMLKFEKLRVYLGNTPLNVSMKCLQWSVRRVQFDAWLLARSNVRVDEHRVKKIVFNGKQYEIDGKYRCDYLIGAGGTHCPVRRTFFPPQKGRLIIAQEKEYACDKYTQTFTFWIPWVGIGYAWCVPKYDAVNVGYGQAFFSRRDLKSFWPRFCDTLKHRGCVNQPPPGRAGWSYHIASSSSNESPVKKNRCYIVGDSVGLATRDLAEGIGPAVESGLLAVKDMMGQADYSPEYITRYSSTGFVSFFMKKT